MSSPSVMVLYGRITACHWGHLGVLGQLEKRISKKNPRLLIIALGIGEEDGQTLKNPLTFEERKRMIQKVLEQEGFSNFVIIGVIDVPGNNPAWAAGAYKRVMEVCKQCGLENPIIEVGDSGKNGAEAAYDEMFGCYGWGFFKADMVNVNSEPISATLIRKHWYEGTLEEVKNLIPHATYETLSELSDTPKFKRLQRMYLETCPGDQ